MIRRLNQAIDDDLIQEVFDQVRNFFYAATFLAAGSFSIRYDEDALFGLIVSQNLGYGILIIGVLLMLLNLYSGIYRLSRYKHSIVLSILLALLYILESVRVVEVMWNFRVGT